MEKTSKKAFDLREFLTSVGPGHGQVKLHAKEVFFTQGDGADSVFYLQSGRAKLTVVSENGKEATVMMLGPGDFFGEESLNQSTRSRTTSATAMVPSTALKVGVEKMFKVLQDETKFSNLFLRFLIKRGVRTEADMVDQLFNSSEKRLARMLLMMAEFGQVGDPRKTIPPITQKALAGMVGTTRSRVSFFMNRFRKLGLIDYNGHIMVYKTLLDAVLHDQLPEQNASRPLLLDPKRKRHYAAKRAKTPAKGQE